MAGKQREDAYTGRFTIPAPKGVYQAAGEANMAAEYAYRAENMRTERGMLATGCGTSRAFPSLGQPIETLTRFYRRSRPDDPQVFVAGAGGAIYTYTEGAEGWVMRAEGFLKNRWSYVTYEALEGEGDAAQTVDILIMSNEKDGMIAIYGSDLRVERKALTIGEDYAEVKFAVLARHAERIWGAGAEGHPDDVFYSRAYDPFDWTGVPETPELGGGVIRQPTWDGDAFTALQPFGDYLLAVKPGTVYEIRGTDPSTFTIGKAYGTDGPAQAATIGVDRMQMIYLTDGGLGLYDGNSIRLLARDALYETMRRRPQDGEDGATACVCDHIYYLALRTGEDGLTAGENNTVIEYDTERGTFMIRKGVRIKDFFAVDGKIYCTQAASPYEVMRYNDPASGSYLGEPIKTLWETAWLDLGKANVKRDFVLRFTAEADEDDVPVELAVITERKEKARKTLLRRQRKDYRVKIQNSGKRVKLRIRSGERAAGWRIHGGIDVEYTADEA